MEQIFFQKISQQKFQNKREVLKNISDSSGKKRVVTLVFLCYATKKAFYRPVSGDV